MLARRLVLLLAAIPATVLALGGPGQARTVQWDFEGDLAATTDGDDLIEDFTAPEVGPLVDFDTVDIDGADANVATFSRGTFFRMTHGCLPNGGGAYVNQYTLILDVMFPDTTISGWTALFQTNTGNANDGDWFLRGVSSGGGIGISGNYGGDIPDGAWHRLALVVDLVAGTFTSYVDGVQAMQLTTAQEGALTLDGRWSLDPEALLFADEAEENSAGLVNSVQFRDEALSADEIAEFGGPTAEGIPLPTNPRDCAFRSFTVSYDPAANAVTGAWALLAGDGGFRVLEGARQVGADLPATATTFTDAAPPKDASAAVYTLQCLVGGNVETECVADPIVTYRCAADLSCSASGNSVILAWTGAVNTSATGYEILRDGTSLATVGPEATGYTDATVPGPGVYAYVVQPQSLGPAVCSEGLTCSAAVLGGDILLFDDFDGYATDEDLAAAGWEVVEVNFPTETGAFWTLTNPGRRGNPPTADGTPSTGKFLVSDSDASPGDDHQGSGMSHDILSPPFDATGKTSVWLHLDCSAMLNNNGEVVFDIDVTADGGDTWTNVFRRVAAARVVEPLPTADIPDGYEGGPQAGNTDGVYGTLHLDLSDVAAGEPEVRIRLRQFEPSDDWWIAVDNVRVDATAAAGGPRTLLETDFADGIPGDWDAISDGDGLAPWRDTDLELCPVSILTFSGGVFPDGNEGRRLHYFGDAFAMVALEETSCVPAAQDEWLATPSLDCSGTTAVWLQARSSLLITGAVAEILLSVDGGTTWDAASPVFTYNAPNAGLYRDAGNAEVVANDLFLEVPAAAGKGSVAFAFHYVNAVPDAGFWAIDDVKVTADGGGGRPRFHRGDPNDDGEMNITDGIYLLNYLFLGGPGPTCDEAGDANNDAAINITDGIFVLNFLFLGGAAPPLPGPPDEPCGTDTDAAGSAGDLGCAEYTSC